MTATSNIKSVPAPASVMAALRKAMQEDGLKEKASAVVNKVVDEPITTNAPKAKTPVPKLNWDIINDKPAAAVKKVINVPVNLVAVEAGTSVQSVDEYEEYEEIGNEIEENYLNLLKSELIEFNPSNLDAERLLKELFSTKKPSQQEEQLQVCEEVAPQAANPEKALKVSLNRVFEHGTHWDTLIKALDKFHTICAGLENAGDVEIEDITEIANGGGLKDRYFYDQLKYALKKFNDDKLLTLIEEYIDTDDRELSNLIYKYLLPRHRATDIVEFVDGARYQFINVPVSIVAPQTEIVETELPILTTTKIDSPEIFELPEEPKASIIEDALDEMYEEEKNTVEVEAIEVHTSPISLPATCTVSAQSLTVTDAVEYLSNLPDLAADSFQISIQLSDLFAAIKGERGYRNITIEDVKALDLTAKMGDIEFNLEYLMAAVTKFTVKDTFIKISIFFGKENPEELQKLINKYLGGYERALEFLSYFKGVDVSTDLINEPAIAPVVAETVPARPVRARRPRPANNQPKMKDIKQAVYDILGVINSKDVRRVMVEKGFTVSDLRRKDSWLSIQEFLNN